MTALARSLGGGPGRISENGMRVLEARYLRRDPEGKIVETPAQLFERVARAIAGAELLHGTAADARFWEERFHRMMASLDFLPNSPTLMNAGTSLGQLSACFVLPVEDTMESIFGTLRDAALIQRTGGGTGFSFSRLRPAGDVIASTGGKSSGPVSFMRIYDCATENIKLGGRRRGANMGVLRVDHPDIEEFVQAKRDGVSFRNFNISVGATDEFMSAVSPAATSGYGTLPMAVWCARCLRVSSLMKFVKPPGPRATPDSSSWTPSHARIPFPARARSKPRIPAGNCRCCRMSPATWGRSIWFISCAWIRAGPKWITNGSAHRFTTPSAFWMM